MPFTPLKPADNKAAPRRGFTPVGEATQSHPASGFTPLGAEGAPAAPGVGGSLSGHGHGQAPAPQGQQPVAAAPSGQPGGQETVSLPDPTANTSQDQVSFRHGPAPLRPTPPVSQETKPTASLMPDWARALGLPGTPQPPAESKDRTPDQVVRDFQAGNYNMNGSEFAGVVHYLEQGAFHNPEQVRALIGPHLSPDARAAMDNAVHVRQLLNEHGDVSSAQADMAMEDPAYHAKLNKETGTHKGFLPVGDATKAGLEGFLRGATNNMVQTHFPTNTGNPESDKLAHLLNRAGDIEASKLRSAHPVASMAGEAVGQVLPFVGGVQALRGLRVARDLAPVEDTIAGYVKEGAKVGGAVSAGYRPDGSENMTLAQDAKARALQGGIGIAAGAIIDFGTLSLNEWAGSYVRALADKRFATALGREAKDHGFTNPDEYVSSLVEFVDTPDGVVVRPRKEAIDALPGKAGEVAKPGAEPPPQGQPETVPAAAGAQQHGFTPVKPAEPFPTEHDLRLQEHASKAAEHGLTPEQARAFAPEDNRDPLTGFHGRRDRVPTLERAVQRVDKSGEPGHYVAMDIANLGGLNARFGEPGADRVYKALSGIAEDELSKLPGHVQLFRHGGDEISAVIVGADDKAVTQAVRRAHDRARQYVQDNGLAEIPHTKAGKPGGSGLHYGIARIRKGDAVDNILERAHTRLEAAKVGHGDTHVDTGLSETARPRGFGEQPGGAEGVPPRPPRGGGDLGAGDGGPGGAPGRTERAQTLTRANEYERLASQASDPNVRADLQRQADVERAKLTGEKPKLSPTERARRARIVDPAKDDLITAIRKLGGLDVATESDWAGRLSHLPRKGFGLHAIEQSTGGGRTLDDLAETLHEYGYLQTRDAGELANKLGQAESGHDVYSMVHYDSGEQPPPPGHSDQDWYYARVDNLDEVPSDFVIDTDSGTIVPARPLTEEDLVRIQEEERNAEEWFQKETASANDQGAAGGVRLPERVSHPAQEVRGDQPRPGEAPGAAGHPDSLAPGDQPPEAAGGDHGTLHANPVGKVLLEQARELGIHPWRNAWAGAGGGVVGAVSSKHEAGSPGWWADVLAGAGLGIGVFQIARATRLLGAGSIVDNAMARIGRYIDSLPLIGRGPEDLREFKRKQRLMQQIIDRQTENVGKVLLERFTPAERGMMADIIETRGIVPDLNIIHRQAQLLDDHITHAAERMKELGMLPPDLETGGYLHRYYAKHLGLDKLFRQAKGESLSGSYSIARGTDGVFHRNYLSKGARDIVDEIDQLGEEISKLEGKRGDVLDSDTLARISELKARRRELGKRELVEHVGDEHGMVKSFLFTPDEVATVPETNLAHADRGGTRVVSVNAAGEAMPPGPVRDLSPTDRRWTIRGTRKDGVLLHRDWTKAERQSWGEIDDAGYRYVRGMAEVSHDMSLATLYDTVGRRSDWVSETPRSTREGDWIEVPSTKVNKKSPLRKYGSLSGKYVRPDVWNGIRNYGRAPFAPGPVGNLYRSLLSRWKLYKTVYNPVTHLNNTYSNVEMLFMGGYSKLDLYKGLQIMLKNEKHPLWREARDAGMFGTDWSTSIIKPNEGGGSQVLGDLAEKMRTQPEIPDAELSVSAMMRAKEWWINSKNAVAGADTKLESGRALARAMSQPVVKGMRFTLRPVKLASRSAQRLYRFEDEVFKMAAFQAERNAGTPVDEAVMRAESLFFDYNDLPEGLKLIRDFPVGSPFISYTYFAIPAIAKNIVRNPERVFALVAGYEAWNYGVLTADGLSPGEYWTVERSENTAGPPWERGRSLWGALNTVHMPYPEGYRMALGRAHALGNPFMSEAGGRKKLPTAPYLANFWGSSIFGSNPMHAVLDVLVNEDWKGKEIYKPGAPEADKVRASAAYLWQAWAPSNPLTPGGYQQSKILEGLANEARKAREEGRRAPIVGPVVDGANHIAHSLGFEGYTGLNRAGNEIVTRDALLGSFGIKLRPFRLEQSVDFELGYLQQERQTAADWYRSMVEKDAEHRISAEQMDQVEREFNQKLDDIDKREDSLLGAEGALRRARVPYKKRR